MMETPPIYLENIKSWWDGKKVWCIEGVMKIREEEWGNWVAFPTYKITKF